MTSRDEDAYTWQMVDLTEDGDEVPDWPKVTYRRIVPEADGTEFWSTYLELVKGTWEGVGAMGVDNKQFGLTKGDAFTYELKMTPVDEAQSMCL